MDCGTDAHFTTPFNGNGRKKLEATTLTYQQSEYV